MGRESAAVQYRPLLEGSMDANGFSLANARVDVTRILKKVDDKDGRFQRLAPGIKEAEDVLTESSD